MARFLNLMLIGLLMAFIAVAIAEQVSTQTETPVVESDSEQRAEKCMADGGEEYRCILTEMQRVMKE